MGFPAKATEQGGVMANKFPIWKVVKLGIGLKTADDFRRAFKEACCKIGESADDIIGRADFIVSKSKKEVDLVIVSPADLGFRYNASRSNIYKRALELGLELCPSELGPQLCLQTKNHPHGEYFNIAMMPIIGSNNIPRAFGVERNGKTFSLHGNNGNPETTWTIASKWIFVRRR